MAAIWEGPWLNDTFGVALMTIGWILVFRKISSGGKFYEKVLLPVSKASYGMYLSHLLILGLISGWMRDTLGLGTDGVLGSVWTTPVEIFGTVLLSFIATAVACVLVQRIPKVGKWIVG
jgi:surface polysaccharide O-acyltransferase-like enzyme